MQDLRRIIVCLLLACVLLLAFRGASAQTPEPLTEVKIVTALKSGGITQPRLVTLVNERGVDFALTPKAEQRLRSAGAGDELIAAIRKAKVKSSKPTTELSSQASGSATKPRAPATGPSQTSGMQSAAVVQARVALTGTLKVVSQPPGAQLYIDDVPKGTTSESEGRLVLEDIAPGSHRVRLAAAGYREWNKTVSIEAGHVLDLDATLQRAGPATATQLPSGSDGTMQSDSAEAFLSRGNSYSEKGEDDRAIQDYDQVIRLRPDAAAGFNNRGNAYIRKGEHDRAIQDFDQAIRLQPDLASAFSGRGLAHCRKGEHDRAIQDYDQAIRLKPDLAIAFFNRGFAYSRKRDYDRAIQDYDQAIRLEPDDADAYYQKGVNLVRKAGKRNNPAAAESLNKYLALAPAGRYAQEARLLLTSMGKR